MSSKRARRSGSDRGRSPPVADRDVDCSQIGRQISNALLRKLDRKAAESWPKEFEGYVACPFTRHNPMRYANIPDCACTGHGFKGIADLKDHIKRVHSARYGCHRCKERYQCRDNTLAETDKKHKKSCKYANKEPLRLNDYKPEWMTPEEDERYFAIDFRKKDTKSPPTLEDQYLRICVAIWPNFDNQNINIWSKPGHMVSRVDIHNAFTDPELIRHFYDILGARDGIGANGGQDQVFYDSQMMQPIDSGISNLDASISWNPDDPMGQNSLYQLNQLNNIPQPNYYTQPGPKDSAYWSSETGEKDKPMDFPLLSGMLPEYDNENNVLAGINSSFSSYQMNDFGDLDILVPEVYDTYN